MPIKSLKDKLGSSPGTAGVVGQFVNKFSDNFHLLLTDLIRGAVLVHENWTPLEDHKARGSAPGEQHSSTQRHMQVRTSDRSFGQLSAVCMIGMSEYKGKPLDMFKVDAALVY